MVRKQVVVIGLAVLLVFAGSMTAFAGRFGGGHSHRGKGFQQLFKSLDLSETQKTQVADIRSSYKEDMDVAHDALAGIRQKIHAAMVKKPFDGNAENELRLAFREASLVKEDLFVLRAKMMNEIRDLLTDEQKEKLANLRAERREKMEARRAFKRSGVNCPMDAL